MRLADSSKCQGRGAREDRPRPLLFRYDVEHTIGKSTEQGAPHVEVDDRQGKRIAFDRFETAIKHLKELITKVVTSLSIPRENPLDVRLRCGREAEHHFLRAKESRTCDQGRAASGSLR